MCASVTCIIHWKSDKFYSKPYGAEWSEINADGWWFYCKHIMIWETYKFREDSHSSCYITRIIYICFWCIRVCYWYPTRLSFASHSSHRNIFNIKSISLFITICSSIMITTCHHHLIAPHSIPPGRLFVFGLVFAFPDVRWLSIKAVLTNESHLYSSFRVRYEQELMISIPGELAGRHIVSKLK